MLRIKAPASSANLGPGFDCLGLAFDVYNTFDVELSDHNILENCEERFSNEDNLFLQAYRKGCEAIGVSDHVHVIFSCDIPVSRGMGSSAAFISAGITAASALHGNALSEDEIFRLICKMEGHPDNASACLFGGLTASEILKDGTCIVRNLPVHESWKFTLLVPDFEIETSSAREILPFAYPRSTLVRNTVHAILMVEALRSGDLQLLRTSASDLAHEPYRKALINDYEKVRRISESDTGGRLVISGSGSTCLLMADRYLSDTAKKNIQNIPDSRWQVIEAGIACGGTVCGGNI